MLTWRRHRLDLAVVVLAVVILVTVLPGATGAQQRGAAASAVALLLFLARRVQPLAVSLLAFAVGCLGISQSRDIHPTQFVGILVLFALVGAVNSERDAVIAWAAGALTMAYATSGEPAGERLSDYALTLTFCSMIWTAGLLVARRDRRATRSDARAQNAERSRAEHARVAIEQERARIATELHDIVSHGLSVVIVQAVAARQSLDDVDVEGLDRRLGAVEATARDALSDMRRMLGLLQLTSDDGPGAARTASTDPSPGLRNLPQLLDQARSVGLTVAADADDLDTTDGELGAGLELAVYRIVQEGLTNAIKHAPGSRVHVRLTRLGSAAEGRIDVEVTNGPSRVHDRQVPGAGYGLIGLTQRCDLYGGRCEAQSLPDGGFRLHASLPVAAADVAHVREQPA